jgi:hypothetical protein
MKKDTAVETMAFLLELEIGDFVPDQKLERIHKIIGHAKAMEKEQIIKAFCEGYDHDGDNYDGAEISYYNETYGGEE